MGVKKTLTVRESQPQALVWRRDSGSVPVETVTISLSPQRPKWRRMPRGHSTRGQPVHVCDVCQKVFSRREHLRRHWRRFGHGDEGSTSGESDNTVETSPHSSQIEYATELDISRSPSPLGNRTHAELELVKYYLTNAHELYLHADGDHNLAYWLDCVPQVLSGSGKMLDEVLSISCAHMALRRPDQAEKYRELSTQYHVRALASQRKDLETMQSGATLLITEEKEALMFVAFILRLRQFVEMQMDSMHVSSDEQHYDDIVNYVSVCAELPRFVLHIQPSVCDTAFTRIVLGGEGQSLELSIAAWNIERIHHVPILIFNDIVDFAILDQSISQTSLEVGRAFLGRVDRTYRMLAQPSISGPTSRRRTRFASTAPTELAVLLQQKDAFAIAVYAWAVGLDTAIEETSWRPLGHVERKLECMKGFLPDRWLWAMDMPLQLARGEMTIVGMVERILRTKGEPPCGRVVELT